MIMKGTTTTTTGRVSKFVQHANAAVVVVSAQVKNWAVAEMSIALHFRIYAKVLVGRRALL